MPLHKSIWESGLTITSGTNPDAFTYLRSTLLREPVQVIMETKFIGGSHPPGPPAEEEKTA